MPSIDQLKYHLTWLRHAQSLANEENILQGQLDSTLSGTGIDQSKALAQHWRKEGIRFDLVVASPLKRAFQTAEIISQALQIRIEEDPNLMERNFGEAEGKSFEELKSLVSDEPRRSPYRPAFESGESDWDLFLRASAAIQDLLQREPGRYLVVSHGGFLNFAIHSILGIPPSPSGYRSVIRLSNCGYAITEYSQLADQWVIFQVNETCHLTNSHQDKGA